MRYLIFSLPNPNKPEPKRVLTSKFLHSKQRIHWLGPNPNKPEPKRVLTSKFLHNKQRIHWLGPNPDKPAPKMVLSSKFLHNKQGIRWLGPNYFRTFTASCFVLAALISAFTSPGMVSARQVLNTHASGTTSSMTSSSLIGASVCPQEIDRHLLTSLPANEVGCESSINARRVTNGNVRQTYGLLEDQADLSVSKTDSPDPIEANETLTYKIDFSNDGPDAAVNVVVSDTLPSGVTYLTAIPAPVSTLNPIVWELGTLNAGEDASLLLVVFVEPEADNMITNTVVITSETPDPNSENNINDEATVVGVPTAVSVTDFDATTLNGSQVLIEWTLAIEWNIYGYRLYRSLSSDPSNALMIYFEESVDLGSLGIVYDYVDTPPHTGLWRYWLTEVSISDRESQPYGPVIALLGEGVIYLPGVVK